MFLRPLYFSEMKFRFRGLIRFRDDYLWMDGYIYFIYAIFTSLRQMSGSLVMWTTSDAQCLD